MDAKKCGCGQTKNSDGLCDGSHLKLNENTQSLADDVKQEEE